MKTAIAVHGGVGVASKNDITKDYEAAVREVLERALMIGHALLQKKSSALDATEAAVCVLEDSELFNAAKGSVFTSDGKNEMDAAIMDGSTLRAGAVAGLHRIKNPIRLARKVVEESPHVLLIGEGAEVFAKEMGVEIVDPTYFFTQTRYDQLQQVLAEEKKDLENGQKKSAKFYRRTKFGTVGAVAMDAEGRLASATSTGGLTNKKFGRVGDSPLIGAGTFANSDCAISCTGDGEHFIRTCAAATIAHLMEFRKFSLDEAAKEVLFNRITPLGGEGGLIAVGKHGELSMPFNSEGMYRASVDVTGKIQVSIY